MGLKVSAMEAARLTNRGERTIRRWIATGQLVAQPAGMRERGQGVGPYRWLIDMDDLSKTPGVTLNRNVLAELEARGTRRARYECPGTCRADRASIRTIAGAGGRTHRTYRPTTEGEGGHAAGAVTIGFLWCRHGTRHIERVGCRVGTGLASVGSDASTSTLRRVPRPSLP